MYDWWLETVGMGEGVRAGVGGETKWRAQLNLARWGGVDVVNRGREELPVRGKVMVEAFNFAGLRVGDAVELAIAGVVPGGSVVSVGEGGGMEAWKERIEGHGGTVLVSVKGSWEGGRRSWYWLRREGGEWTQVSGASIDKEPVRSEATKSVNSCLCCSAPHL